MRLKEGNQLPQEQSVMQKGPCHETYVYACKGYEIRFHRRKRMHATAREGREHSQSMGASIDLPPRVQLSENLLTKHGQ